MSHKVQLGVVPVGGRSHVLGDKTKDIWNLTIPSLLKQKVRDRKDNLAVVFSDRDVRWSYFQFKQEVDRLSAAFIAIGLGPGDRVCIWSANSPEWLTVQFATAQIGAILVTINPAYRVNEAQFALKMVGASAVVLGRQFKTSDYVGMITEIAPEISNDNLGRLNSPTLPKLRYCIHSEPDQIPGMLSYGELLKMGEDHDPEEFTPQLEPDQPINIQFTSGTTGAPKGATLTHRNIINNARFVASTLNLMADDRLCIPVPLYHCFGMVMGSLACITSGSTMIFPSAGFVADLTLNALEKEKCTALYGVPTMFTAMLEILENTAFDLSSLRTGIMAGAPCPMEIMRRVIDKLNMKKITIAYGMTETSPVSFQSHVDDPLEKKVGTVGRIHPHVEVKVINPGGQIVPVGEQGELCTRGYSVMQGYWNDQEATSKAIDNDGWMHTGDLAIMDKEGYCKIVGRLSDMVIRGGENIYPREIEEFIYTHHAVKIVQVFGIPDEIYGEELCAWIVLRDDADVTEKDIREHCRGQIAHYKIPKYICFRKELPMTVTGKPQKFRMQEMMVKEMQQ